MKAAGRGGVKQLNLGNLVETLKGNVEESSVISRKTT